MTATFLKLAFTFMICIPSSMALLLFKEGTVWEKVGRAAVWICSFGAGLSIICAVWST